MRPRSPVFLASLLAGAVLALALAVPAVAADPR